MWYLRVGKYPLKPYSIWWFIPDLFLRGLIVSPAPFGNDISPNNPLPLFGVTGDAGQPQLEPAHTWHFSCWTEAVKSVLGQRPEGVSVSLEVTGSWQRLGWSPAESPCAWELHKSPGLREGGGHTYAKIIWGLTLTRCPDLTPETRGIQLWILLVHVI